MKRDLTGCVAVVTGATRGAGLGIAHELGAAGATVYVTGRSSRGAPSDGHYAGLLAASPHLTTMPGTVEDTAEVVCRAGGTGIAVRVDHGDPAQVEALFARVETEQGRLDLLVNNAWGGHEAWDAGSYGAPFWEQDLAQWEAMFDRGVRLHLLAARCAAPCLVRQGKGTIVGTTFWDRGRYIAGNLFYDLAKASLSRLALGIAEELRPHGIASVALSPGWMRTELVLAGHGATEETWTEVPALARTESPRYLGRAVVALATDPDIHRHTGQTLRVADLAAHYGFDDIDGRRPPPFEVS